MRVFVRLAFAAAVLAVVSHTRADPDLWGHVRFGHDMVTSGVVRIADQYSFASDRPWVNHEWLAESLMYLVYALGGATGLIALKVSLLVIMLAAVVAAVHNKGVPTSTADLLLGIVVVGVIPQAGHVRPQLFSLALFAWLLVILVRGAHRRTIWASVPILVVWANLHGGWIVGAGTLAAWAACGVAADRTLREWRTLLIIVGAAVAATVVNPYGWHLWKFLAETVGFSRPDIIDWQPVYRLGLPYLLLWALVTMTAAVAVARARKTVPLQVLGVVSMLAVASFRVNRLQAFYAIAVVMLLGPHLSWRRTKGHEPVEHQSNRQSRLSLAVATFVGVVIMTGSLIAGIRNAGCIRMDPVSVPDPEVVALVEQQGLRGRMLTWFDWGEYAIWYWGPTIVVSVDGRRETVYSDAAIQRHLRFYFEPSTRHALLDVLHPDYIWLPSNLSVVNELKSDGWTALFSGTRSVLLAKAPAARAIAYTGPALEQRCFPGP